MVDEINMTPLQVHCWKGKLLLQMQSGTYSFNYTFIHDGAVGMRDLGIMPQWYIKVYVSFVISQDWADSILCFHNQHT